MAATMLLRISTLVRPTSQKGLSSPGGSIRKSPVGTIKQRPNPRRTDSYEHFGLPYVAERLEAYEHYGGQGKQLDEAILDCTRAMDLLLPSILSDPVQTARWSILTATGLRLRFDRDGEKRDLDEAEQILVTVLASATPGGEIHTLALYGLGRVFETSFHSCGAPEVAESAYACFQLAMRQEEEMPEGCERVGDVLPLHLAWSMKARPGGMNPSDAIALYCDVMERVDETSPLIASVLHGLSGAYFYRWRAQGRSDKSDLIRSEDYARRALLYSHRFRYRHLIWLATVCQERFESGDGTSYIHSAIDLGDQAMDLIQDRQPTSYDCNAVLTVLGLAYDSRFRAEGNLQDIDRAIGLHRLALQNMGERAPLSTYRSLISSLSLRFEEMGNLADIDEAVKAGQQALAVTPPHEFEVVFAVAELGRALALRFIHGGEENDSKAATGYLTDAMNRCAAGGLHMQGLLDDCMDMLSKLQDVSSRLQSQANDEGPAVE